MVKRFGVRVLDHVLHNRWSALTLAGSIAAVATVVASISGVLGMLDKAPPERLERFTLQSIYPSELAEMRSEQAALTRGFPMMTVLPLWDVPPDHMFELANRDQVNRQISALRDAGGQVAWPCDSGNEPLEAIRVGLGEVDGGAGRDNSAVFYHRAVAALLTCNWSQADRDFAALEGLLDDAVDRRPETGWENSEPRLWAVRAAAQYLQGDMELRRIDADELDGDARREAAARAFSHYQAAANFLRSGDSAAIARVERNQPFPTTDADAALVELDSADIVNQMAVAALMAEMDLGDDWRELFAGYVSEQAALSDRPLLGLNLQMLALTQGRRRESRIFQPSSEALAQLGEAGEGLRLVSNNLADMSGRPRGQRGGDRASRWRRIGTWRNQLSTEEGNPAEVIRSYATIEADNPDRGFYRTFLREVSASVGDQPDPAREAFRVALPREVRGGSWAWLVILVLGLGLAVAAGVFAELVRRTAEPLYGRDHYRDRTKSRA